MKNFKYKKGGRVTGQYYFIDRLEVYDLLDKIIEKQEFVNIVAPRATGKSSLIFRVRETLKDKGYKTVYVDFRRSTPPEEISNKEKWWIEWVVGNISHSLKIERRILKKWYNDVTKRELSLFDLLDSFFSEFLAEHANSKLVVIFDETEKLKYLGNYTDQFLELITELYETRVNPNLQIVFAGIYPSHMLISRRSKISDFKVDIPILKLRDYLLDDAEKWSIGINGKIDVSKRILDWSGGHPYVTSLMHALLLEKSDISIPNVDKIANEIIVAAKVTATLYPHFRAPFDFLKSFRTHAFKALYLYERLVKEKKIINGEDQKYAADLLYSSGLVKITDNNLLISRSKLYLEVFDLFWVKDSIMSLGSITQSATRNRYLDNKNKPKICLINYGGTIGMVENEGEVVPPLDEIEFLELYPGILSHADITYEQLDAKDGTNIFPEDWSRIAEYIFDKRNNNYDGFVIAMGTDTLQYASSAVSYSLGEGLQKPVVFVGAQATHQAYYGDAQVNLLRAIKVASVGIPEVVVAFNDKVFRAVRVQKVNDFSFHGFASPTLSPLATIGETIEVNKELLIAKNIGRIKLINEFEDRILQISHHPGMNIKYYEDILDQNRDVQAILIEALGIGNITNRGDKYNFMPLIKRAIQDLNIPVVIASRYPINPKFIGKYIPAMAPMHIGAIHALNMSSSAALTKLMWLLPQIQKDIELGNLKRENKIDELKVLMEYSFVGEVDNYTKE